MSSSADEILVRAGIEIVDADIVGALSQQRFAEMRAEIPAPPITRKRVSRCVAIRAA